MCWGGVGHVPSVMSAGSCLPTSPSEGGLGKTDVDIRQMRLRFKFLDRMCQQDKGNDLFWKEDVKKVFPSMRRVHEVEEETRRTPRAECFFFHKYRLALKEFSLFKKGLSETGCCLLRHYILC